MCGIAGIIKKDKKAVMKSEIKKMTDILVHRGPDSSGKYIENNIGFGHRRLSILDLSCAGTQPMVSHDGNYIITFNGEIYNYLEIKEELIAEGSVFFNNTDTEVILESYKRWKEDCVNKFNGMWAFAIYDRKRSSVFMSRDRFGIKPFYFLNRNDVFVFSSEAKAILELFQEERKVNFTQVFRFIKGYPDVMDNKTFYRNIFLLEAGYNILYNLHDNSIKKWKYWDLDYNKNFEKYIKGKNPYKELKILLEDAVRIRLRSDVPLGCCLSGGIDSGIITGIIRKKFNIKLNTFSSIYEDKDCNEKEYIDCVNTWNNTNVHYIYPDNETNLLSCLEEITWYHDGPILGGSLFSGYCVYREASKYVKVLIDGQGADEIFAGYLPDYNGRLKDILQKKSLIARLKASKLITIFKNKYPTQMGTIGTDIVRKAYGNSNMRFWDATNRNKTMYFREIFSQDFLEKVDKSIPEYDYIEKVKGNLNYILYHQIKRDCIPNLMRNVDSNSMNFSVEVRNPFMDYRIVEFAMALDSKYKIKNQWTKYILRKSCKNYLPDKVLNRTNKMGFPAPFGRWVKESSDKEKIKDIIFSLGEREGFKKDAITEYYNQHMKGICDRSLELCKFLTLELWWRNYIDKWKPCFFK
ncbi:MAG: asparagine synthase (glutamine-hydrolyzing) [Lachnospiraceae bacterium]|nr:asparagine synthase (glutamine-hydrolyzing) [Lachnospiraceae bacterium]